jgi:hypothetical protein
MRKLATMEFFSVSLETAMPTELPPSGPIRNFY